MASPFSIFRRNQKIMLAVVGVAAMVAFVFLDPLMRYVGGGSGQAKNPVVVETAYGDLNASELEALRYQRMLVDTFLQRVLEQAIVKQMGQSNIEPRWLSGIMQQQYRGWKFRVMGRSVSEQEQPEKAAIETMVMAHRAKQMGLVISDESINDMIKQLSGDSLTSPELQKIIQELQPQRPVSVPKLFDALRTELLASQYRDLFTQTLADIPPAQRYEYYSRLNRRAKTEVMSLAVADFIGQVAEPTDAEVTAFYEKYKNQFDDPTSPEPGFKEPKRASFQYFKAGVEPLTEKLKPEITDEEIAKYYEENKQNFPAMSFDEPAADAATGDKPAAEEEAKPAGDMPATETPAEPKAEEPAATPATEEPKEEKPAASEEKPAEDSPEEAKPEESKPAEAQADETAPAEKTPTEEPAEAESPQADFRPGGRLRGAGQKFRFASLRVLQTEEEAPAETAPPAGDKPAEEKPAAEEPAEPAKEEPAAEKPTDEPADAPASEEKPAEGEPAGDKPADPGDEIVAEPAVPASEFEPLDKVADTIRTTLAREKAAQKLSDQFDELSAKMRRYADDHDVYETDKGTNPSVKAPAPLNFAELAKGTDVEAFEINSASPLEIFKQDIGKSFRTQQSASGGQGRTVPFVEFAYADTLRDYKMEIDQDAENNFYLFWKTSEEPAYVPPLDQIREKVVREWKLVQARDLAKKRAEEYAKQAKALKKPLAELFGKQADAKIVDPAPFSWLTLGNVPAQQGAIPRLSEVDTLDQAGKDFMKTVFSLPAGELGVAMNQPEDVTFVIRVIEFEPSQEQLRDEFAREDPNRYLAAGQEDQVKIYQSWIADLEKEADIKWIRQADVRRASQDEEEEF